MLEKPAHLFVSLHLQLVGPPDDVCTWIDLMFINFLRTLLMLTTRPVVSGAYDCLFVCLFVWCLTTHQPLWVISVKRY